METNIENYIKVNEKMKEFMNYPIEELKIMKTYIVLDLISFYEDRSKKDEIIEKGKTLSFCTQNQEDCLEEIVSYRCNLDFYNNISYDTVNNMKKYTLCNFCNMKNCVRKSLAIFIKEIDKSQESGILDKSYTYEKIINHIIWKKQMASKRKEKSSIEQITQEELIITFDSIIEKNFQDYSIFENIDYVDLLYVQTILEADLIKINKCEGKKIEAEFFKINKKERSEYYINIMLDYYKNEKDTEKIEIDLDKLEDIFQEKDSNLRIYKIAIYYKYLLEYEDLGVIKMLRKYVNPKNMIDKFMNIRDKYFIVHMFNFVEKLKYSNKTKEQIYNIFNYVLNFWYGKIEFIPINIIIYTRQREISIQIALLIQRFMYYFKYTEGRLIEAYIEKSIVNEKNLWDLYYEKKGIILLHNIENLISENAHKRNGIVNMLTNEIEISNGNTCTIIDGDKNKIKEILTNNKKLYEKFFNYTIEVDNLVESEIYNIIIEKIEKEYIITENVKNKIYEYINYSYKKSNIKNMEYVTKLYNKIILSAGENFEDGKNIQIEEKDIPNINFDERKLEDIMADLNELIILKYIKEEINYLVSLLKFNKKININMNDYSLHMCFLGNPGTGKTTVAKIITEILYNLGYIQENKFIEVTDKDLVAEYIGQTAGKTYNVIESALGGVLFIDEAYSIVYGKEGTSSSFSSDCISTLTKYMEEYKDKLIIIFAGYKKEMEDFLEYNPGLSSRIGYKINFEDYTIEELTEIYTNLLKKNNLKIEEKALEKLKNIINEASKAENFGNGRYIYNIFFKILIEHSRNVCNINETERLVTITEEDINYERLKDEEKNKIGF